MFSSMYEVGQVIARLIVRENANVMKLLDPAHLPLTDLRGNVTHDHGEESVLYLETG